MDWCAWEKPMFDQLYCSNITCAHLKRDVFDPYVSQSAQ
jgi:hypothetical protein